MTDLFNRQICRVKIRDVVSTVVIAILRELQLLGAVALSAGVRTAHRAPLT